MSNNNENPTNQENNNNDLPVIENPTSSEQQQQENPPSPKKEENPKESNNTNPEIDNNIQNNSQHQEEEQQNDEPEIPSLPREKWVVLESLFQRNGIANKPTNFSLEVYGIYSVPEWWKKLENSGAVDAWGYQVRVGEALTINGKYNERELTDEEKLQAENKKKGPPKIDKKNPDAVKAEEERLAKIEEEKKQLENDFYNELNKLEPIDRFYKIKEIHNQADWISFDNEEVGRLMGEAIKDKIGPDGGGIYMICGPDTDANAVSVEKGFSKAMENSNITVLYKTRCENWNAMEGYEAVKTALENYPEVDAIMCGNDDIATQVFMDLSENRLAGKVLLTGQDCDLMACQRIVQGTQLVSIYKSFETEARAAAENAIKLAKGEDINVDSEIFDGKYTVKYLELEPLAVTADNIDSIIVDGGVHTEEEVYSR